MMNAFFEMRCVCKSYPMAGEEMQVLKNICLEMDEGEYLSVLGPSGSGKSTLMNIIGCLDVATSGLYVLHGREISETSEAELAAIRSREIGFIFQNSQLLPRLTAQKNVELPLIYAGVSPRERRRRAGEMLERVGLADRMEHFPNQLSSGQQQRVALARILCSEPEAILLDEPFSALDSYLKWNLEIELADLLATFNGPILWVSHDRDECYRNCRSVCVMEDGRTGEVTPMDEMIRHPGSVSAARLAGCKNFFAAEARDGKVYLPEWNVALPLAGMENTFTTIGIPDNAVTMSENGAMSCTVCRMILGVEENILLLRPEGSAEGAPMLRITVGHESDLQAGAAVRVALDYSKLLLL